MTLAPTNTDLPSSWEVPGIYLQLDLTGSGAALNSVAKRALLIACKTTSGSYAVDSPVLVAGQATANAYFGQGSDLARLWAATNSQNGTGVIDLYCLAISEPSAGTAATNLITFATTATASGAVKVTICGYSCTVDIASGDTPSTVATNVSAAINLLTDLPVTAGVGSATVTLTYRHKGVHGNDLPVRVEFIGSPGMTASPGTLAYATNASGAGSATVTIGGVTITAAISNADTPTVIGAAVAAAINGGAYPVTASADTGTVTLYYAPERDVRRISAAIVTSTGTTVTPAVGTSGAGAPTLTTALANVAKQAAFKTWATAFNDTTSLGLMATHIESYADGRSQKGQLLFAGSCLSQSVAGAIPSGTSPVLTAKTRYGIVHCPDAPQQAYELAGRYAAMWCQSDYAPQNFNGEALKTKTDSVPLMLPHRTVRLDEPNANVDMKTYGLTPLVVNEQTGELVVLKPRSTYTGADARLRAPSVQFTMDYYRYDLNTFLATRFRQKSLKRNGTPATPNTVTPQDIRDAVYEHMIGWDGADLFDGAASVKDSILCNVDQFVPTRVNVFVPCKPPLPLDQIAGVAGLV